MATGKKTTAVAKADPQSTVEIRVTPGETQGEAMAAIMLGSEVRHGYMAATYAGYSFGTGAEQPSLMDTARYVRGQADKAATGDLDCASRILTAQAIALDSMFTELARRSTVNMGQYLETADRYARLALKAQSNCRATLEALAKLHQPREQTVKHVHIGRGGQAVVADQFHHHQEGVGNAKTAEQSHATGSPGAISALPSPDPLRDAVPIAGGVREAAVPDARRD